MRRAVVTFAVVGLLLVGSAAAAGLGHNDPRGQKLEGETIRLLNQSMRDVAREHPRCRFRTPTGRVELRHGSPDPALLKILGVLRRPATIGDSLPNDHFVSGPFFSRIYVDYVRQAMAADGQRFFIVPERGRSFPFPPARCLRLQQTRLIELLRGKAPELKRFALREKARLDRQQHTSQRPRDGVLVFSTDGGGGGGLDATGIARHGELGSSGRSNSSQVSGLIPDGVVSITATFDRAVSRGPYRNPKVYPTKVVVQVPVSDNVIDFRVARPAEDAFPNRMVWHLTNGRNRVVTSQG